MNRTILIVLCIAGVWNGLKADTSPSGDVLQAALSISSQSIMRDIEELCRDKYAGRLTGTPQYHAAAQMVADRLADYGVKPALDQGYFQEFPNPYTLVLDAGELTLHLPVGRGDEVDRPYLIETEYIPGSTSASGRIRAEVVYVGYGISAPELGYDDYLGVDVRGKIVLMEPELPVSPDGDPEMFKRWRPYSFHDYKVENALRHGAVGMLYHYHIANPNCRYFPNFLLTYVGERVVTDLFAGSGKSHKAVRSAIVKRLKPASFSLKKHVTLANRTEHHPEGRGINVIGIILGSDPSAQRQIMALGGHLDHVGMNPKLMPGANDNASAVAVMLEIARAFHRSAYQPRHSILFLFFGAEEQGVAGSAYYLKHPVRPNERIQAFFNMDGVGRGDRIHGLAAKDFPVLEKLLNRVNDRWIHRQLTLSHFHNRARPRLDAAHFLWAKIPTVSFSAQGLPPLPFPVYHRSTDRPEHLTPEIMEDLARLLFLTLIEGDGGL